MANLLSMPEAKIEDLEMSGTVEGVPADDSIDIASDVESLSAVRVTATHGTSTNPGASDEDN